MNNNQVANQSIFTLWISSNKKVTLFSPIITLMKISTRKKKLNHRQIDLAAKPNSKEDEILQTPVKSSTKVPQLGNKINTTCNDDAA